MESISYATYFEAVLKYDLRNLLSSEERQSIRLLWPALIKNRSRDDQFQFEFIRTMLAAYKDQPAHARVSSYLVAYNLGDSDDQTSISNSGYLKLIKSLIGAFMHFAESAEVLEAFQPLFSEAEALIATSPDLSLAEFSAAEKKLRLRIYQRHTEVRRTRPGLIKWDPDGLS